MNLQYLTDTLVYKTVLGVILGFLTNITLVSFEHFENNLAHDTATVPTEET